MAAEQHGVVTRAQLLGLGLTSDAIDHRLRKGRLHRVHRGVYAVGRPQLTRHGVLLAAVLSCGPGAALSHAAAAELWGIRRRGADRGDRARRGHAPAAGPARPPQRAVADRPRKQAQHPRDCPSPHPCRSRHPPLPASARGRCQRSRQARPGRPRAAADRCRRDEWPTRRGAAARAARPPRAQAHRLRARATLPADRSPRRVAAASDPVPRERLPGRLLLARARAGGRDRRPALPPHSRPTVPGPRARSGARPGGLHPSALHAWPDRPSRGRCAATLVAVAARNAPRS